MYLPVVKQYSSSMQLVWRVKLILSSISTTVVWSKVFWALRCCLAPDNDFWGEILRCLPCADAVLNIELRLRFRSLENSMTHLRGDQKGSARLSDRPNLWLLLTVSTASIKSAEIYRAF